MSLRPVTRDGVTYYPVQFLIKSDLCNGCERRTPYRDGTKCPGFCDQESDDDREKRIDKDRKKIWQTGPEAEAKFALERLTDEQ